MADIFISYARDDAAFAAHLKQGIEDGGFSVWIDSDAMAGGERWTEEIESAIESAGALVVVVSRASNNSVWVRREVLYGYQLEKPVVPVLAEDVPLPALLVDLNAVPLHQDFNVGLEQLLAALRAKAVQAPASTVEPAPAAPVGKLLGLFVVVGVVVALAAWALPVVATGLGIGAALLAMAWKADDAISLQLKRDISLWLRGLDPAAIGRSVQEWPTHFAALFDWVFGKKHLSWRCFFRSSIASLIAFVICTFIYLQAAPGELDASFERFGRGLGDELGIPGSLAATLALLGIAAIANLLPDYVSLLETRWVIGRMGRTPSLLGQWGWLAVDFVATGVIFVLFFLLVLAGSRWLFPEVQWLFPEVQSWEWVVYRPGPSKSFLEAVVSTVSSLARWSGLGATDEPFLRFFGVPVWTTYFTSVWVWLYFLAQFLMRLALPLRRTVGFLKYALPVEQQPLRAVGVVMASVALVVYCAVMLPPSTLAASPRASSLVPDMVEVPAGTFRMGDAESANEEERPVHTVTIREPFAIGRYEVTFAEYDRFCQGRRGGSARTTRAGAGVTARSSSELGGRGGVRRVAFGARPASLPVTHRGGVGVRGQSSAALGTLLGAAYWWGDDVNEDEPCGRTATGAVASGITKQTAPVGQFRAECHLGFTIRRGTCGSGCRTAGTTRMKVLLRTARRGKRRRVIAVGV